MGYISLWRGVPAFYKGKSMLVKFPYSMLGGDLLYKIVQYAAQKCDLATRKAAFTLSKAVEKATVEYKRDHDRIFFIYSKEAPANFPNAGARIIEAALMSSDEYEEYLKAVDALNAKEGEAEWTEEKPKVKIPSNVLAKLPQFELEAIEVFFDVQEGPAEEVKK
jgi:hypothetical protein